MVHQKLLSWINGCSTLQATRGGPIAGHGGPRKPGDTSTMTELEGILRAGEFLFSGSLLIPGRPVSGTGVIN